MTYRIYSEQHDGFRIEWDYDPSERVWTVATVADDGTMLDSDYVPRKEFLKQAIADAVDYAPELVAEHEELKAEREERKAWNREHGYDENTIFVRF